MTNDLISRQAALEAIKSSELGMEYEAIEQLPSAQPERKTGRFTAEEIKTIRIHMNAHKEQLCNQRRWKEAEEYQQIVDKLDEMTEVDDAE